MNNAILTLAIIAAAATAIVVVVVALPTNSVHALDFSSSFQNFQGTGQTNFQQGTGSTFCLNGVCSSSSNTTP